MIVNLTWKGIKPMKIALDNLTELEQAFVKAAVNEWNDLMFGDDLNHGIPKQSLGGVMGSLVKKGVIANDDSHNDAAFQFVGEDGWADYDEAPVLVSEKEMAL